MHMKPDLTGIGRRIQKLRQQKGITQEQLAEMADIACWNTVSVIENGHARFQLARLFGLQLRLRLLCRIL